MLSARASRDLACNYDQWIVILVILIVGAGFANNDLLQDAGYLGQCSGSTYVVVGHRTEQDRKNVAPCHSSPFRTADWVMLNGRMTKFASMC